MNGCTTCGEGTYSAGGTVSLCSNCPSGKTVGRGDGSSQSDCSWSKSIYEINLVRHILRFAALEFNSERIVKY